MAASRTFALVEAQIDGFRATGKWDDVVRVMRASEAVFAGGVSAAHPTPDAVAAFKHTLLGEAASHRKRYDEARRAFTKALSHCPSYVDALTLLALVNIDAGVWPNDERRERARRVRIKIPRMRLPTLRGLHVPTLRFRRKDGIDATGSPPGDAEPAVAAAVPAVTTASPPQAASPASDALPSVSADLNDSIALLTRAKNACIEGVEQCSQYRLYLRLHSLHVLACLHEKGYAPRLLTHTRDGMALMSPAGLRSLTAADVAAAAASASGSVFETEEDRLSHANSCLYAAVGACDTAWEVLVRHVCVKHGLPQPRPVDAPSGARHVLYTCGRVRVEVGRDGVTPGVTTAFTSAHDFSHTSITTPQHIPPRVALSSTRDTAQVVSYLSHVDTRVRDTACAALSRLPLLLHRCSDAYTAVCAYMACVDVRRHIGMYTHSGTREALTQGLMVALTQPGTGPLTRLAGMSPTVSTQSLMHVARVCAEAGVILTQCRPREAFAWQCAALSRAALCALGLGRVCSTMQPHNHGVECLPALGHATSDVVSPLTAAAVTALHVCVSEAIAVVSHAHVEGSISSARARALSADDDSGSDVDAVADAPALLPPLPLCASIAFAAAVSLVRGGNVSAALSLAHSCVLVCDVHMPPSVVAACYETLGIVLCAAAAAMPGDRMRVGAAGGGVSVPAAATSLHTYTRAYASLRRAMHMRGVVSAPVSVSAHSSSSSSSSSESPSSRSSDASVADDGQSHLEDIMEEDMQTAGEAGDTEVPPLEIETVDAVVQPRVPGDATSEVSAASPTSASVPASLSSAGWSLNYHAGVCALAVADLPRAVTHALAAVSACASSTSDATSSLPWLLLCAATSVAVGNGVAASVCARALLAWPDDPMLRLCEALAAERMALDTPSHTHAHTSIASHIVSRIVEAFPPVTSAPGSTMPDMLAILRGYMRAAAAADAAAWTHIHTCASAAAAHTSAAVSELAYAPTADPLPACVSDMHAGARPAPFSVTCAVACHCHVVRVALACGRMPDAVQALQRADALCEALSTPHTPLHARAHVAIATDALSSINLAAHVRSSTDPCLRATIIACVGLCHEAAGAYTLAEAQYDAALAVSPSHTHAHVRCADIAVTRAVAAASGVSDIAAAVAGAVSRDMRAVIQQRGLPKDAAAALLQDVHRILQRAETHVAAALQEDPYDAAAWLVRARIHACMGAHLDAARACATAYDARRVTGILPASALPWRVSFWGVMG